jgi:hypothetical protein
LVEIMKDRLANFFNPSFRMNHFYRKNLTLPEFAHDDQSNAIVVRAAYPDLRNESGESLLDEHERKTLKVWMDYVVESKFG